MFNRKKKKIVVGIGKACHDCSIAVSVNGRFYKYLKYERERNIKQINAPEWWFYKKLIDWDINPEDVDLFVMTDPGQWREQHQVLLLPYNNDLYWLREKDFYNTKQVLLDHHNAHAWSNMSFDEAKQFVVVDGEGSNSNKATTYDTMQFRRYKNVTPGGIFIWLDDAMQLHNNRHGNSSGKIMGLMQYGKRIDSLFERLMESPPSEYINYLKWFIKTCYHNKTPTDPEWQNFLKTIDDVCWELIKSYFEPMDKEKEIIYSGGCALNIEWNRRLLDMGYKLNIEPPAYDGGLSLGCVRFGNRFLDYKDPKPFEYYPYIQDDVGPKSMASSQTINKVAKLLADGKIVGWYQGQGEVGPRALGNRSILMDPRIKDGKDILNHKVKHREWWRPYGASVKEDKAHKYFDLKKSPYMLYASKVKTPELLPAITHIDGSCRHQTVSCSQNPVFYKLLDSFEKITKLPVLLNTSLNEGGKPIANKPEQALALLKNSKMDAVCIGNKIYE